MKYYLLTIGLVFSASIFAEEAKEACSQEETASEKFKCILTEKADPSHGRIRTDDKALTAWMADIFKPGTYCLPIELPFRLWRETADAEAKIHFQPLANGTESELVWQAGKHVLFWPQLWPADQSQYTLTLNGETQSQWHFLHIPDTEESTEARIIWMYDQGCHEQIPRLIEKL